MSIIVYISPSRNIGHENVGYSMDDRPSVHVEFIRQGEVTFDGENHWQNSDSSRKNMEFQAKNKDSIGFYPEEIGRPAP